MENCNSREIRDESSWIFSALFRLRRKRRRPRRNISDKYPALLWVRPVRVALCHRDFRLFREHQAHLVVLWDPVNPEHRCYRVVLDCPVDLEAHRRRVNLVLRGWLACRRLAYLDRLWVRLGRGYPAGRVALVDRAHLDSHRDRHCQVDQVDLDCRAGLVVRVLRVDQADTVCTAVAYEYGKFQAVVVQGIRADLGDPVDPVCRFYPVARAGPLDRASSNFRIRWAPAFSRSSDYSPLP